LDDRRRKRIVIATIGSLGDLHPYMAVALGLRLRGHHVVLASLSSYRSRVESAGLDFRPLRLDLPMQDREFYARLLDPKKGAEFLYRDVLMPVVADTYDDLRSIIAETDANLLVSNPVVFAAPLIAEKIHIPWASTVLQPMMFLSAYDPLVVAGLPPAVSQGPPFLRPWWGRRLRELADLRTRSWNEPVRELRRQLSLPPPAKFITEGQHSPNLVLAMFSRALGSVQPDWPPQTCQTGFAYYDEDATASQELDETLKRYLDEGPAPIVFTLGSTVVNAAGEFYAASIAAAQAVGRRALLLVGKEPANRSTLPVPLPKGVAVFDYAPHAAVFTRAAAVVHQGGVGTVAQALRAGIPSLVVPFFGDQPDNAARIARIGVGRVLARNAYTGSRAAGALNQLLNDGAVVRRAKSAAEIIASERGVDVACDALARL
jgi:rhamnosyltransferase subunit B